MGFSIVLCGEAGQGIQTVELLLMRLLKNSGYSMFATREFMSRIRGGYNSTEIRVDEKHVSAFIEQIDLLIPLLKGAIKHVQKRVTPETIIMGESDILESAGGISKNQTIEVPFTKLAQEMGGKIYANIIASGVLFGLFKADINLITNYLTEYFSDKGSVIVDNNIKALRKGYQIGTELLQSDKIKIQIPKNSKYKEELIFTGTDAVAMGAIAGGCNFISSYPMSPSTGVLTFLSQKSEEFEIIAEQAEDEISAINMALGAWYAGGRGMVTTSGGGFALMVEGLSLSGVLETPVVIHLAQRPGPGTGLPTRTEQADLLFSLYTAHGEFPRIILAPGKIKDGFHLTQLAFNLADKYQVPVIILTDQFFLDSTFIVPSLDLSMVKVEKSIIKTTRDYKRYQITSTGISPRGIPGYGDGLVAVDSDEHDESGHITENHDIRIQMVNKRLRKLDQIKKDIVPPELIGPDQYKFLVICWGTSYNPVKEALENLGRNDLAMLYFCQIYPLHANLIDYMKQAKKTIIVEGNATAQFAQIIKLHTGVEITDKILKFNGLPFSVEEIQRKLEEILS